MQTINPDLVPVLHSKLSPRQHVIDTLALDIYVNHVESENGDIVTVEMRSGEWLTIPRSAIVEVKHEDR